MFQSSGVATLQEVAVLPLFKKALFKKQRCCTSSISGVSALLEVVCYLVGLFENTNLCAIMLRWLHSCLRISNLIGGLKLDTN
ncbi:hypothetical protein DITRI_Ditri14bG0077600 [Diplodiscus trichospermus]